MRMVESSLAMAVCSSSGEKLSLSMCGGDEVIHVELEILDDVRFIGGRDVGTGMVETSKVSACIAVSCAWRLASKSRT